MPYNYIVVQHHFRAIRVHDFYNETLRDSGEIFQVLYVLPLNLSYLKIIHFYNETIPFARNICACNCTRVYLNVDALTDTSDLMRFEYIWK